MTTRLVALLLLTLAVAPSVHAQEVGLLLGLRYEDPVGKPLPYYAEGGEAYARPSYRTLLIVRDGDAVRLAARRPNLLVPVDTTFWRIGTKRSVYNDWVEDFVWAAPEGRAPELPGVDAYNGEHCEGHRVQRILYAGRRYLALEQRSAGYCEDAAHPWYYNTLAVVPLDSTTHLGLPIGEVLGAAGRTALTAVTDAFLATRTPAEQARYVPVPDEANWGLLRRDGRWIARVRLGPAEIADTLFADVALPPAVPAPVVGRNALAPSWARVKAFAPDAIDAFSSPADDLLVILRPGRVTAHLLTGGVIGPVKLDVPVPRGSRAAMAQWALAPRVARWSRGLARTSAASLTP